MPPAGPMLAALSRIQGVTPPGAPPEPRFDSAEIQGNILVGFNKDHQALLFLRITDRAVAKAWLRAIAPAIATTDELLSFRRLFRALRDRRREEATGLVATWINIAFTGSGIEKLTSTEELESFTTDAFKVGMEQRAGTLGDPVDQAGNPLGWVIGAGDTAFDILLIIASDRSSALEAELARLKTQITALQGMAAEAPTARGLVLVHEEHGDVLPGTLRGHEHFGFRDGISQPGIRGRVSDAPYDFLTPRLLAPEDPLADRCSRPGQPLIWPGQFVLGQQYLSQLRDDMVSPGAGIIPSPSWSVNGSFLVFRRLQQDVAGFWSFMREEAGRLARKHAALAELTPERLAALMVGRWQSGAPIMRVPNADDPQLAKHEFAPNNFQFKDAMPPIRLLPDAGVPPDTFAPAPADAAGRICPFAAHIRKINPRDDTTELGGFERSLQRRILRRGIPFGSPAIGGPGPVGDAGERGLLFLAYMTQIETQFEFLMTDWANTQINPRSYPDDQGAGHDPIIGQTSNGDRQRAFTLRIDAQTYETLTLPANWVTSTGGAYLFAPSLSALTTTLGAPD